MDSERLSEAIARVKKMEERFDALLQMAKKDPASVEKEQLSILVDYYESGWERSCQFQTYVGNDLTLRCVIFDSLGDSVTSEEFHAFLN